MIRGTSTRQLYESKGPGKFARFMLEGMGLIDRHGRRHTDLAGTPILVTPKDKSGREVERFRAEEFSLRDLAENIVGEDWATYLEPGTTKRLALVEGSQNLLEAGTGAIGPSVFANVNAFTAVVAGLLEISIMDAWQNPDYISDELMPVESTKMFDGRKVIGATRLGDQAEERLPGMPTKRAQIGERWIQQPRTVENAFAVEVTQEAVYLDQTGEVLQNAKDVGDWLRYRKELRCLDAWLGITNTYSYKGTTYNTWLTNGYYNNDLAGNELNHWTNVETAEILFRDMTDPDTGTRVVIRPNTMLVNQEKLYTARAILGATEVEYRDAPGSTVNPQQVRKFANPLPTYKLITSPLVFQRLTDATGLNLSTTAAGKYWWIFEKGKVMKYVANWPLRVQQAAPNQMEMIDRGVVMYCKADERGVPMVYEPRRAVRCRP